MAGGGDSFVDRVATVAHQLGGLNPWATLFAAGAVLPAGDPGAPLPGRRLLWAWSITSIVLVWLTRARPRGLAVVGSVPSGLPQFAVPAIRARDVDELLPLATSPTCCSRTSSVSAARIRRPARPHSTPGRSCSRWAARTCSRR
ncbi:MAG: hypothetical protein U1F09_16490 [Steroidobacteraceae bacterium]